MKTLTKVSSILALAAIMTSSCSVEYKNRHGRHNVIDVGMNEKKLQNNMGVSSTTQSENSLVPVAGK